MPITQLLPSIPKMMYLTHKKIFEGLEYDEDKDLETGLLGWPKSGELTYAEKRDLSYILQALIANENGEWDRVKETFKQHNISWKICYRDMWT